MPFIRSLRGGDWRNLAAAFIYFGTSFVVWSLPGVLGVSIASTFGLNHRDAALAVAIPLLGGALLRIPMGLAADRFGCKRVGLAGLGLTAAPLLWMWLGAGTITQVYLSGFLLGIAGASFAVALPFAGRSYPPEDQGMVMGIAGTGNVGTAITALAAPALAALVGWRGTFGLALLPLIAALLLVARLGTETRTSAVAASSYGDVLRRSDLWWLNLFYGFTFGGFVGLTSFLVLFLHGQYGLDAVTAGRITAAGVILASLARPVGGVLGDRWGGVTILVGVFALGCASLLVISLLPPLSLVTAALMVLLLTLGVGNGAVFQLVPQCFRDEVGAATGIVGACGGLGGFGLAWLLGALREATGSYASGFVCFALLALVSLGALAILGPVWRERWVVAISDPAAEEHP